MSEQTDEKIRRIYVETIQPLRTHTMARSGGDEHLAEDVIQEAWVRAVREWRKKGVPSNPGAWLATVARNLMISEFRKPRLVHLDESTHGELLIAEPEAGPSASTDLAEAVQAALDTLPEGEAQLLETFYGGRSRTSSIAASLGISERAVEGRLRRARKKLRKRIEATLGADAPGRHSARASWFDVTPTNIGKLLMTGLLLPVLLVLAFFPVSVLISKLPRRKLAYLRLIAGPMLIALAANAQGATWSKAGLAAFGVGMITWALWNLRGGSDIEA